jgi:hypothetical protein
MLLQDVRKNGHYVITKGTPCKTLQKCDRVFIKCSGRLELSGNVGGWLNYDEWKDLSAEVDVDVVYYQDLASRARSCLSECQEMLGNI